METEIIYEEIRDILLQHCEKDNPISAKEISSIIGFPMEDTQAKCRAMVHKTAIMYNLPVISCGHGFFSAKTKQEINEYNKNIDDRINGMEKNRQFANENFRRFQNDNKYKK